MFRHYITSIDYAKLIEMQANMPTFGVDKEQSKKHVVAIPNAKGKKRVFKRTQMK